MTPTCATPAAKQYVHVAVHKSSRCCVAATPLLVLMASSITLQVATHCCCGGCINHQHRVLTCVRVSPQEALVALVGLGGVQQVQVNGLPSSLSGSHLLRTPQNDFNRSAPVAILCCWWFTC
jgi:hypothetical protein